MYRSILTTVKIGRTRVTCVHNQMIYLYPGIYQPVSMVVIRIRIRYLDVGVSNAWGDFQYYYYARVGTSRKEKKPDGSHPPDIFVYNWTPNRKRGNFSRIFRPKSFFVADARIVCNEFPSGDRWLKHDARVKSLNHL